MISKINLEIVYSRYQPRLAFFSISPQFIALAIAMQISYYDLTKIVDRRCIIFSMFN